MSLRYLLLITFTSALLSLAVSAISAPRSVKVGDAFAQVGKDGKSWSIGTKSICLEFEDRNGQVHLASFQNRLVDSPVNYITAVDLGAPFSLDLEHVGQFDIDTIWSKKLQSQQEIDTSVGNIRVKVKKGDLIGFSARTRTDIGNEEIDWVNVVEYDDGQKFASSDNDRLEQGPVWFYYLRAPGTGCMELMRKVTKATEDAPYDFRSPDSYRTDFDCPRLGLQMIRLLNSFEPVRVWKAPKDGVVTVKGVARHVMGREALITVVRISERSSLSLPREEPWVVTKAEMRESVVGGRPAVQLDVCIAQKSLRAIVHTVAHPGTSVLRMWTEIENADGKSVVLNSIAPLIMPIDYNPNSLVKSYWIQGGNSGPNQGVMHVSDIRQRYQNTILGEKSDNCVPWMGFLRSDGSRDGWFAALDLLGTWTIGLDRGKDGTSRFAISLPGFMGYELQTGKSVRSPIVTLGVFKDSLDDMGKRLYDWQYTYMWDRTNNDYFARPQWLVPWFFCSRNLQEQFTARLACVDMDADIARSMGFEMLWDDAGWSKYPTWPIPDSYGNVFRPTYEGADYSQTLRHLAKMNMRWALWIAGRPSAGLIDTKVGSWGSFQWRTDGVGRFDIDGDRAFREQVERHRSVNPESSFQTCSGGSRYSHMFEIQRLADAHQFSDLGRGDETNYYLSYLHQPDRWVDLITALYMNCEMKPDSGTSLTLLTMTPVWAYHASPETQEQVRRVLEIYRYLKREGLAGRWSYVNHPAVKGDKEFHYFQRTSYDRKKAVIIPKHKADRDVIVYPRGLIPTYSYSFSFQSDSAASVRTGSDLMKNGIVLSSRKPVELIYLGMPNSPGSGQDKSAPAAPSQVLARRETNIGHSGMGIYWSSGSDNNWISYYEVRREDKIIGKASIGAYYFDHSEGWSPALEYAVRTVDGDGNVSEWTVASQTCNEPTTAYALGGHFSERGREGWSAETTVDGSEFVPMSWVQAVKRPAGDLGGTPNQPGGVEGYWQGLAAARIGRGWQQADSSGACVRTWTAPSAGKVRIIGRAMKECYRQNMGGALRVRILHETKQVWPDNGWAIVALNDLMGVQHDFTIDVQPGDRIRFVLDKSASPEDDIVAWMPIITYVSAEDADAELSVVRINCGAAKDYTDQCGNVWSSDKFFTGGKSTLVKTSVQNALPTPADQGLYQSGRQGSDFTYSIPVKPGLYTVRLKFAETAYKWSYERPMDVTINGLRVLNNFDICQSAYGPGLAYEKVFRYLVPDADGNLVLRFTGGFEPMQKTDQALVNAIEVVPEIKPVVRIDAGSDVQFVDWNSFIWNADEYFDGGEVIGSDSPVSQASPTLYDQKLYQTARSGKSFSYTVPVPPGLYTVHLKFAELWLSGVGQRPMNIYVNGCLARENWDAALSAGQTGMAADIRMEAIAPDRNGRITIQIDAAGANNAILQGIEVE